MMDLFLLLVELLDLVISRTLKIDVASSRVYTLCVIYDVDDLFYRLKNKNLKLRQGLGGGWGKNKNSDSAPVKDFL